MTTRIELPEKEAKQLSDAIDRALEGESVTIQGWGFEIVLHTVTSGEGVHGFINDTSG